MATGTTEVVTSPKTVTPSKVGKEGTGKAKSAPKTTPTSEDTSHSTAAPAENKKNQTLSPT